MERKDKKENAVTQDRVEFLATWMAFQERPENLVYQENRERQGKTAFQDFQVHLVRRER